MCQLYVHAKLKPNLSSAYISFKLSSEDTAGFSKNFGCTDRFFSGTLFSCMRSGRIDVLWTRLITLLIFAVFKR